MDILQEIDKLLTEDKSIRLRNEEKIDLVSPKGMAISVVDTNNGLEIRVTSGHLKIEDSGGEKILRILSF